MKKQEKPSGVVAPAFSESSSSELLTRREIARPQSDAIFRILLGKWLEISSTPIMDGIRRIHEHRVFTQTGQDV